MMKNNNVALRIKLMCVTQYYMYNYVDKSSLL